MHLILKLLKVVYPKIFLVSKKLIEVNPLEKIHHLNPKERKV